ncbi:NAD(P)-binding protein [Sodalis sp. RH22]|uniref:NAD(P)-binding protein n=1 Tax=unclassified Sodalis (in: enterobacteria) TaxID=2636512 RepID=UPI0039B6B9E7
MTIFSSFWQAGFEAADHRNRLGEILALNEATGHIERVLQDYNALKAFNITTVRESVGWRLVEGKEGYDFSSLAVRMAAANKSGMQLCWTICHYGWPEDIDVFSPDFVSRFARLCGAVAAFLRPYYSHAPVYSPINEISFTSWGISVGLFSCSAPPGVEIGKSSKRQLVRACLAACDAIWAADPRARILHCDPIIFTVASDSRPEGMRQAADWQAAQFESWDMLSGVSAPELGGAPRYLDIIGANYYHDNQWESENNQRLFWHLGDPRRRPLHDMLQELYHRYKRPLLLAETSHVGSGRGAWIGQIAADIAQAQIAGVELLGICLYPIIDRPDWENKNVWHHSGLWDLDREGPDPLARILDAVYASALLRAQHMLALFQRQLGVLASAGENTYIMKNIYVFSHLRWDFVFQRPQHLMTRLAQHYRIFFIEEPIFSLLEPGLNITTPAPNITVIQPHTPIQAAGFHDSQIPYIQQLLAELMPENEMPIVWFYTPMALPLLAVFTPALVIYDCMDELSAFEKAPRQLMQRESALLARADIVFTGGPSLYAAKAGRHPNVHCFASSVDTIHFEQARDRTNHHPLQDQLPHPRLGYFGVIDERMDLALLAALADAHPQWQLIMVGPVVKIDPAFLPQRPNIHYFGMQPYQALPQFLAGWDVCLMPFALNASTRFISPTKVLEYMAALLPVVSSAITDVEEPYGHVVAIGQDHAGFIRACEDALVIPPASRAMQQQQMKAIVDATSWDKTAQAMHELIENELTVSPSRPTADTPVAQAEQGLPVTPALRLTPPHPASASPVRCLILGAGPTGLSAAYHYGSGALLLERNKTVGGWCRSVEDRGFTFDYAGHIMFSNDPYVLAMYDMLLGDNIHWQEREAWIYTDGIYTRYPFQGALHGLPAAIIKECILGAIAARYEPPGAAGAPMLKERCVTHGVEEHGTHTDCCADGAVPDFVLGRATDRHGRKEDFEQFIYRTWGAGIARHFAIPYNKKLWTVPLADMETSWLGGRVPLPDLAQIIEGALGSTAKPMGPNARFGYPLRGGFQALMSGFLPHIGGTVETGAEVKQILAHQHIAVLADGRQYSYEQLISTMPLPELIRIIGDEVPVDVRAAAAGLRHVSVRCVNLGIGRANLTDKHWIYFAGNTVFHRIFVQGNASPLCNPPGGCGLTCEISYSPLKPLPAEGKQLIDRCIAECIAVGMFSAEDTVITANQIDIPYAYVIYDHAREQNIATVRQWLLLHDIVLSGRYSEWEYYNSDHAFIAGKTAAEKVKSRAYRQGAGS